VALSKDPSEGPREEPEETDRSPRLTVTLALIWPLALLAIVSVIVGRAVAPSVAGVAVGIQHITDVLENAGEAISQTFAMSCTVVAVSTLFAVVRSKLSVSLRFGGMVLGSLVVLLGLGATIYPNGAIASAVLGVSAASVTVLAARDVWGAPFARPIAVTLGAAGVASLLRLASVALAYASLPHHDGMASAARIVATVAFFIDAGAPGTALLWIASRGKKLTSPMTVVVLVITFVLTRQALAAGAEDSSSANVLIRRALDTLLTGPAPHGPVAVRLFFTALGPVVAAAALFTRRQMPALTGGIALVVLGRMAPEVPLHGLALMIGSLAVALASRDDRGLWAALLSRGGEAGAETEAVNGSGSGKRERERERER
jgi:hypothetical protein